LPNGTSYLGRSGDTYLAPRCPIAATTSRPVHTDRYAALLAEQEAGTCAWYVLVGGDGEAGFVPVDPAHLGSKPGTWYQRDLMT
jgi:hypothetical protein